MALLHINPDPAPKKSRRSSRDREDTRNERFSRPRIIPPDYATYLRVEFPLTIQRLMDLCTKCWHPLYDRPFSHMTGEEDFFGFFYPQRLQVECRMLLPRSIGIRDIWEVQRARTTFAANPQYFMCRSIDIVLRCCEEYMTKLADGYSPSNEVPDQTKNTTFIEEAENYARSMSLPPSANN